MLERFYIYKKLCLGVKKINEGDFNVLSFLNANNNLKNLLPLGEPNKNNIGVMSILGKIIIY